MLQKTHRTLHTPFMHVAHISEESCGASVDAVFAANENFWFQSAKVRLDPDECGNDGVIRRHFTFVGLTTKGTFAKPATTGPGDEIGDDSDV